MFRHQALITCKRQLKSLEHLSFSLMCESESGAKVDDKENGLTYHQYSRKLFLKTRPLRGLLSSLPNASSAAAPRPAQFFLTIITYTKIAPPTSLGNTDHNAF